MKVVIRDFSTFLRQLQFAAVTAFLLFANFAQSTELLQAAPMPGFGYVERSPDHPSGWPDTVVTGYYYVDNTHAAASDLFNNYGTPDKPRRTLPSGRLAAGSYVEIHGGPYKSGSATRIIAAGTFAAPVWIRGGTNSAKPIMRQSLVAGGSYLIIENLMFDRSRMAIDIAKRSNNIVIRDNDFSGPGTADGYTSVIGFSGSKTALVHDIVILRNEINGFGDASPGAAENDYHGIKAAKNCSNIWILENHIYDMSGDSVQIGKASLPDNERCHHVYIARNEFHSNKENAVDIKNARDVIVSQNLIHTFNPNVSGEAIAIVIHNNGDNIWIVGNRVHDASIGIINTGAKNTWFIANEIFDISSAGNLDIDSYYGPGVAMHMRGNSSGGVVNNTVHRYEKGVQISGGTAYEVVGNIFAGRTMNKSFDVMISNTKLAKSVSLDFNLYENFAAKISSSGYRSMSGFRRHERKEINGIDGEPNFLDPAAADFRLAFTSVARNSGTESSAYARFKARYGLDLRKDIAGITRPVDEKWSIGARENPAQDAYPSQPASGQSRTPATTPPAKSGSIFYR